MNLEYYVTFKVQVDEEDLLDMAVDGEPAVLMHKIFRFIEDPHKNKDVVLDSFVEM